MLKKNPSFSVSRMTTWTKCTGKPRSRTRCSTTWNSLESWNTAPRTRTSSEHWAKEGPSYLIIVPKRCAKRASRPQDVNFSRLRNSRDRSYFIFAITVASRNALSVSSQRRSDCSDVQYAFTLEIHLGHKNTELLWILCASNAKFIDYRKASYIYTFITWLIFVFWW